MTDNNDFRASCVSAATAFRALVRATDSAAFSRPEGNTMTQDTPAAAGESVWLFKDHSGKWCHFVDEQHRRLTIESGAWIVQEFRPTQDATSAAGGATGDLPEAAWPAGTRGMLGENAYDADQMRQHFNAGREFEASRRAALAAQSPDSGAGPVEALIAADMVQLEKAVTDFIECGETDVPESMLMRFVSLGLLECDHYQVLPAAHDAINAFLVQQGAQNG